MARYDHIDFTPPAGVRDEAAKGLQPAFDPNSPGEPAKPSDIPGTSGNRPPAQYPFPLDPIL